MIYVDYREGSKELFEPLGKRGLAVEIADMDRASYYKGRL